MSLNIFGPYGSGINPTTTRPTDTGDPGASDTWFQPCSSPTVDDGTRVSYRWLNKILATVRRATRGMGIADDPATDDLLLEAIKRGATLKNIGNGESLYGGQDSDKAHMIRRLAAGSNITLTVVEGPSGEYAVRIAATAPGSGPTGNTLGNVGDGADVYKGTNSTVEELRGIKGIGPIGAAVNSDNVEVGLPGDAYQILMRDAGTTGQMAGKAITALTTEASPATDDYLLLGKNADGAPRKVTVANVRGSVTANAVGSFRVVRGSNVGDGGNVSSDAISQGAPGGSTWIARGAWWYAQYSATGPGEPIYDWHCLAQRTA